MPRIVLTLLCLLPMRSQFGSGASDADRVEVLAPSPPQVDVKALPCVKECQEPFDCLLVMLECSSKTWHEARCPQPCMSSRCHPEGILQLHVAASGGAFGEIWDDIDQAQLDIELYAEESNCSMEDVDHDVRACSDALKACNKETDTAVVLPRRGKGSSLIVVGGYYNGAYGHYYTANNGKETDEDGCIGSSECSAFTTGQTCCGSACESCDEDYCFDNNPSKEGLVCRWNRTTDFPVWLLVVIPIVLGSVCCILMGCERSRAGQSTTTDHDDLDHDYAAHGGLTHGGETDGIDEKPVGNLVGVIPSPGTPSDANLNVPSDSFLSSSKENPSA